MSGKVLATRKALLPPILTFAHQLHGNFLMGREGRAYVGWLGIAMLLLGASGPGLVVPRRGQWKYAFIVRRTARGLRFHRELHAMLGIWAFLVFMAVSFSGVVLAWPVMTGNAPPPGGRAAVTVEPVEGATRIGADQAAALALAALPGAEVALHHPARPPQPGDHREPGQPRRHRRQCRHRPLARQGIVGARSVRGFLGLAAPGASGAPWTGVEIPGFPQRFLPAIFVFTGVMMWAKKRTARIPMSAPLIDTPIAEGAA